MKRVIILLILLICTGCSVEYNLTINDDLSVDEEIIALQDSSFYDKYYKSSISRVIDIVMTPSKEYLETNNYNVQKIIAVESGANVSKRFSTLEEFYNTSKTYSQLFSSFSYKKDENGIVSLVAKGEIFNETNLVDKYIIDEAEINIKLPFKVIDNNADKYDKKTNTYTWYIKDDMDYKEINIRFNTNKKYFNYYNLIPYFVLGIVIILIIFSVLYTLRLKNKSNEI